ncbi:MAG: phosphoglycerate kinase, partial [Patescibacteria group bacterium]|nr:phosphoglycerate kinase [Patescibacteria group bacterium]
MILCSLEKADVKNKTVLLRADLDLPLEERNGQMAVADDFRLQHALPTIKHLLSNQCKVVIIAHLDRPKTWDKEKSLQPVAEHLAGILKYKFMALDKTTAKFY